MQSSAAAGGCAKRAMAALHTDRLAEGIGGRACAALALLLRASGDLARGGRGVTGRSNGESGGETRYC